MRRKRSVLTSVLNCKVTEHIRRSVEALADEKNLSLGEATRHYLELGIKHAEAI